MTDSSKTTDMNLEQFAIDMLKGWPEPWSEGLDGSEIQEIAHKHGILIAHEVSEPCSESCNCAEWGDWPITCYRLHPALDRQDSE